MELISLLIVDGQLDAASAQVADAREARGGDLRLLYFEALIAYEKKDMVKARELSQQLVKRAPEHVPSLVLAGGGRVPGKATDDGREPPAEGGAAGAAARGRPRVAGANLHGLEPAGTGAGGDPAADVRSGRRIDAADDDAGRRDLPRQR